MPQSGPPSGLGAALSGPPATFELDGDIYALAASWRPLAEYLPRANWQLDLLLDMVEPEDGEVLAERLTDPADPLGLADVEAIAETLVQIATGWPYWVVQRLLVWAGQHWPDLDGLAMLAGVDLIALLDAQPGRACNVLYALLVRGADEKEREKIDAQLFRTPPELDAADPPSWMAEEEGASFMAAMATTGQRVGAGTPLP
jgi:hypothetical protein